MVQFGLLLWEGVWKCDPKNNSYKNYSYKKELTTL